MEFAGLTNYADLITSTDKILKILAGIDFIYI